MNTFCISGRRDPGQLPALRQGAEYTVIGNKDGISVYIGGQLPATPDTDTPPGGSGVSFQYPPVKKMTNDPWIIRQRLSKNLAEDVRDRAAGGCVRGAKSPPRVQSNRILKLF